MKLTQHYSDELKNYLNIAIKINMCALSLSLSASYTNVSRTRTIVNL